MKDNLSNTKNGVKINERTEDELFEELVWQLEEIFLDSLSPEVQKYVVIDDLTYSAIKDLAYNFKRDEFKKYNNSDIRLAARTAMISAF